MQLSILSGTNRPGSNTRKIAGQIFEIYQALGVAPDIIDLAELPSEIFDPSSYAKKPASFAPFSEAILKSDGVVVVAPEYNGGLPGVLKYFIDMLKFPESFEDRAVCLVGIAAGEWGGLRTLAQIHDIFVYRHAHVFPRRVYLPKINALLGPDGRLPQDAEEYRRLCSQAEGFLEYVRALGGTKPSAAT